MTADMTIDIAASPAERVNVLRRADTPAHFLWRGRLYAVRSVRAHWFEGEVPGEQGDPGDDGGRGDPGAPIPTGPVGSVRTDDPTAPAERAGTDESGPCRDRELWRVEAASGRMAPTGVFDLCLAWPDGDWTLASVPESAR